MLGLPVLAVLMSVTTMRRLIVSPLGVSRHVRTTHAGWRWVVVLAAGLVVLAWAASQHAALKRFGDATTAIIVGGSIVCIGLGSAVLIWRVPLRRSARREFDTVDQIFALINIGIGVVYAFLAVRKYLDWRDEHRPRRPDRRLRRIALWQRGRRCVAEDR